MARSRVRKNCTNASPFNSAVDTELCNPICECVILHVGVCRALTLVLADIQATYSFCYHWMRQNDRMSDTVKFFFKVINKTMIRPTEENTISVFLFKNVTLDSMLLPDTL